MEEKKTPVVGQEKLTPEQLSAYYSRIEQEYKRVVNHAKNLEKELEAYKVNDYYNRTGLLFEIIKFVESSEHGHHFSMEFVDNVYMELEELIAPNKKDTETPGEESPTPENKE